MASAGDAGDVRPQDNITEAHVKAALTADKGSEANLVSWSIKDFTNKGDNYATIVTSVSVKFSLAGQEQTTSYVVKLNPKRTGERGMSELGLIVFLKEAEFFQEILPLLNAELTVRGLQGLRVAKWFYTSLEKDKEMIFLEDLRSRGFKMFDRKKGMDVAHATLVLQELARLHAASLLLKATAPEKDLADRFTHIKDDWMNFSESAKQFLNDMFSGPIAGGEEMLHNIEGYEVAEQWLAKHKNNCADLVEQQLVRSPKFDVICHGDCWNNNVLFRYNKNDVPVEVMLLDLQVNRMASPATDLNYFLYTSLHGNDRKANWRDFLSSYYDTLRGVMEAGGRDMPFTLEELHQEYRDKMEFGLLFATMTMTIMLGEAEDSPDMINMKEEDIQKIMEEGRQNTIKMVKNNSLFRSRFLAVFDDLIQPKASGLSVEKWLASAGDAGPARLQDNITEAHVKAALTADKGSEADLVSWSVKDFTHKGDNYTTIVTSVSVTFSLAGRESTSSYVIKLKLQMPPGEVLSEFFSSIYKKEAEFFQEILPLLNAELTTRGLGCLRMAKWFYMSLKKNEGMIFFEDLRSRGFKMFDCKKGMDVAHATLVLQELATLHAASLLLKATAPDQDLADRFTHIKVDWMNFPEKAKKRFNDMFSTYMLCSSELLHNKEGYEVAEQWLAKYKTNCMDLIELQLARNSKFDVLCHGDCWINNMLFRYNENGDPVEVMLLDLQLSRVASPATDLNYFLYIGLHGNDRKTNWRDLLSSYYDTFRGVMEAGGRDMPFTLEELHQEYRNKMEYGMIFATFFVPILLGEREDAPYVMDLKEEIMSDFIEKTRHVTSNMMENNPDFRSRFLALFDDLIHREPRCHSIV
ncbi:uncharacterized protein [Procambarus clarkii]|uniref:uncharacterized protein n=1 Tax=Procambarus clarkii TaxID=6728 RepID=UPI001E6702AF|nr:uncharacterized protein LOC123748241 [Procambarus clarkii]